MGNVPSPLPAGKMQCDKCRALVDFGDIACSHCGNPVSVPAATHQDEPTFAESAPVGEQLERTPVDPEGQAPASVAAGAAVPVHPTNSPHEQLSQASREAPPQGSGVDSVGIMTFVAVLTFGISWLLWLRGQLPIYARYSRLQPPTMWFRLYVGSLALTTVGFVLALAGQGATVYGWAGLLTIVVGTVLVYRVVQQRDAVAHWQGVSDPAPGAIWMALLWSVVLFSGYLLVGLVVAVPIALLFFWLFFRGHNYVVEAASAQGVEWS